MLFQHPPAFDDGKRVAGCVVQVAAFAGGFNQSCEDVAAAFLVTAGEEILTGRVQNLRYGRLNVRVQISHAAIMLTDRTPFRSQLNTSARN